MLAADDGDVDEEDEEEEDEDDEEDMGLISDCCFSSLFLLSSW